MSESVIHFIIFIFIIITDVYYAVELSSSTKFRTMGNGMREKLSFSIKYLIVLELWNFILWLKMCRWQWHHHIRPIHIQIKRRILSYIHRFGITTLYCMYHEVHAIVWFGEQNYDAAAHRTKNFCYIFFAASILNSVWFTICVKCYLQMNCLPALNSERARVHTHNWFNAAYTHFGFHFIIL